MCDELAIPLHRAHFDTRAYAQLHGISIEMAARQLRYAYFRQLREAIGAEAICVAHHRDDSVETILLNLIRGTGIHGLTGMKPRQGDVVRPLLCVSRADLVSYLYGLGRSYVTDSSNLVADVKRNKVRLQILPMIEAINPSFRDTLLTMAAELEGIEQVVDTQLAHYAEATELSIEAIQQEAFCRTGPLLLPPAPPFQSVADPTDRRPSRSLQRQPVDLPHPRVALRPWAA